MRCACAGPASDGAGMRTSRIVGFHQDEEGHWVADLACGHSQHVRHDPPWQNRPWVVTAEGRQRFLGVELPCRTCQQAASGR